MLIYLMFFLLWCYIHISESNLFPSSFLLLLSFLTRLVVKSECINPQVDEELDELISRIKLEEGNTEFWKRRFLGEGFSTDQEKQLDSGKFEPLDVTDSVSVVDVAKEVEDDEAEAEDEDEDDDNDNGDDDEEEEEVEVEVEVEQAERQDVERVKQKENEAKKPLQMIGVQLLKDSDQTSTSSKKSRRRASRRISAEV